MNFDDLKMLDLAARIEALKYCCWEYRNGFSMEELDGLRNSLMESVDALAKTQGLWTGTLPSGIGTEK